MKTVSVTISGIDTLLTLPAGSRIEESGSGSIVWMNKEYGNKQFTIEESPSELITQLSDALLVSRDGKDIIYILTPGSMVKQNGANVDISLYIGGNDKFSVVGTISSIYTTPSVSTGGGVVKKITSADFTGSTITGQGIPALLIGLTPDIQFLLSSDEGSGALLKLTDGYTFVSGTGVITVAVGNYRLQIL